MSLTMILACDEAYGIGNAGGLLYHFKSDLARFKKLTTGKTIVMGRRTWESLPGKLPRRYHVVVSSTPVEGADLTVSNINEVLELARNEDVWIIGGAQIYEAFFEYVNTLEITYIHGQRYADTVVPSMAKVIGQLSPSSAECLREVDTLSGEEFDITFFSYKLS